MLRKRIMKQEYALKELNLAYLGICDEFYALYTSIVGLYEKVIDQIIADSSVRLMNTDLVRKKAGSEQRKIIDEFLQDYTYVFTKKYSRLHPNAAAMKALQILEYKHMEPLKVDVSIVSFKQFLKEFQDFMCSVLTQRERYEKATVRWEDVWQKQNEHILELVKKEITQTTHTYQVDSKEEQELIVYYDLKSISCNRKGHCVGLGKVWVNLLEKDELICIPVHICVGCKKVFIGAETLKVYEKEYGKMFILKKKEECEQQLDTFFNNESELHKVGYNVVAGKISENERRSLLLRIMQAKRLTPFEVCRDIENAIKIFDGQPKYKNAVEKWKSDLLFVGEYVKRQC